MSDRKTAGTAGMPGARSRSSFGILSATIWSVSCLLHVGLLWFLSTMHMARGAGGDADAGGLSIEGHFLGTSIGASGERGAGSDDWEGATASAELQLVSASPVNTEPFEGIDDESTTGNETESTEDADIRRPVQHSRSDPPDTSVVETGPPTARRRSQVQPDRESEEGLGPSGRRPGHGQAGARAGSGSGTTFFDIAGRGTKFVYVVDRSDSMQNKRRLDAARSELLASLNELAESSFVQVLFYNHDVVSLTPIEQLSLLRNSPTQRRKFAQFSAGIQPDGGTDHLRALRLALKLTPDAIFLLTDADEPKLHAADLDKLLRANRRHVPIHAVELGIGPLLESENFLMRLARQNRGTYRYWDIGDLSAAAADDTAAGESEEAGVQR